MTAVLEPPLGTVHRGLLAYGDQVRLGKAIEAGQAAERRLEGRRLSSAERQRLEEEADRGQTARRKLIEAHAPLVLTEAQRYAGDRRTVVELVQQGNIGLVRAVDSFDWRGGGRFSTHAARWIRLAIAADGPDLPDPRASRPDPMAVSLYRDRVVSLDAADRPPELRPPGAGSPGPDGDPFSPPG